MKTVIIYHQIKTGVDCPDGIAAAWVAKKRYPDAEIHGAVYQQPCPVTPQAGDHIVLVDFSYSASVIQGWVEQGARVAVIDHHQTAWEELHKLAGQIDPKENNIAFDMEHCGATLAWRILFPGKSIPAFLEYIKDRDLWNHALPMTEEIHEATAALRRSFALFDVLERMTQDELIRFLAPLGSKLLQPKREKIKEISERWDYRWLRKYHPISRNLEFEYEIPVVLLASDGSEDRLTSDICSYLYKSIPKAPFVACIVSDGSWSLRSSKNGSNFDVSEVAKQFGGGGHRNAAGFKP